jgi:hypothetical protein
MLRYRLDLIAAGMLLLTTASAWAFSLQNGGGAGGGGNSSFNDPDDQIANKLGVRSSEPTRLGGQHGQAFDPIWWDQSLHGYGPYYQTPRRGN